MLINIKNIDNTVQVIDIPDQAINLGPNEIDAIKTGIINAISVGMPPFVPRNDLDFYPKQS